MAITFDIKNDVKPGKEIAGVPLGVELREIEELIRKHAINENDYWFVGPFHIQYLCDDIIRIQIDLIRNEINLIACGRGYQGSLFGDIKVGMKVGEALMLHPKLYWNEEDELVMHSSISGVGLLLENQDIRPEMDLENIISEIVVFNY